MKGWLFFIGVLLAAAGGWWWWRRRKGLPLSPIPDNGVGSALQPYVDSLLGTQPGQLPPVAPTGKPKLTDQLAAGAGQAFGAGAAKVCASYGVPGPLCAVGGDLNAKAAEYYVKAHVKAVELAWSGTKKVGSGGKKVLKALTPGW